MTPESENHSPQESICFEQNFHSSSPYTLSLKVKYAKEDRVSIPVNQNTSGRFGEKLATGE